MKNSKWFAIFMTLVVFQPARGEVSPLENWSKQSFIRAIFTLKNMRSSLEKNNLFGLEPAAGSEKLSCDEATLIYRKADGSCTDLNHPAAGQAGSLLGRNFSAQVIKNGNINDPADPDPRLLSRELMSRSKFIPSQRLNFLGAAWIQFMVHDWLAHEDLGSQEAFFAPLSLEDPLRLKYNQDFMVFSRSKSVATNSGTVGYVNKVTQWWDGSQIYGSDLESSRRLRTFEGGQLRLENGFLPIEAGQELTGANPNWWVGLSLMHTLFVKEHNAIAAQLQAAYKDLSDEELYQKARLINAAVMAKIHALEFSEVELDHPVTRFGTKVNWYGFLTALRDSQDAHEVKTSPGYEKLFPHAQTLTGIVGGPLRTDGVPFAQTTDLASLYRYHTLLPDELQVVDTEGRLQETVPLQETRFENAYKLARKYGHAALLESFGMQKSGAVSLNNLPRFLQEIDLPVMGRIDLGALDIFRDRERGVPRYNEFRRQIGLKPLSAIAQISNDAEVVAKLQKFYHNDIERLDLQIGMLAESHRANGLLFGETQFQLIAMMASRRLQADRFFTTNYNAKYYTKVGLNWVDQVTLKKVLLRHYPELKSSLSKVSNPFRPWGS